MKMKVRELSGAALDWAVAKAEGYIDDCNTWLYEASLEEVFDGSYKPSTDWSLGGEIIEKYQINLICAEGQYDSERAVFGTYWVAEVGRLSPCGVFGSQGDDWGSYFQVSSDDCPITGETALIAAMRSYVFEKFGREIEVPES